MSGKVYGSFSDLVNYKPKGGGKYFSLKDGEEARVRFMYDKLEDMHFFWVHEMQDPYAIIVCPNQVNGSNEPCKWCQSKNPKVARVFIPVFNLEANEVQYWRRTAQFAQEKVIPFLQEQTDSGVPLAGQIFKIKRMGEGIKTTYTVIPTGAPDNQTKNNFGTVEDEYDLGLIKESDFDYDSFKAQSNGGLNTNYTQNNYQGSFGNNPMQATRRTATFD